MPTTGSVAVVPPKQRCFRHLKGVVARNIKPFDGLSLPDTCFSLHQGLPSAAATSVGELQESSFYISEIVQNSVNPNWRHLEHQKCPDDTLCLNCFTVCVWDCSGGVPPRLLFDCPVDFQQCEFIGKLKNVSGTFPGNTILLEMVDGFFLLKAAAAAVKIASSPPQVTRRAAMYSKKDFLNVMKMAQRLAEVEHETNDLVTSISHTLAAPDNHEEKLQQREMMQLRVSRLRLQKEHELALLQQEKEETETMRAELLPHLRTICKSEAALIASKKRLEDDQAKLRINEELLIDMSEQILARKWKLISQLRTIYPITQCSDGKCLAIGGFRLPNSDFTGCDEEQIATALGCVCHVVFMISKYLEVPLRYPMVPMCSRSIVRDDISHQISPKFPLYSRGVDRTRFEYAVFLLNKNIEQLLNDQGLDVVTLRHTLPNLQILLSHNPARLKENK